ncbi:hypothetical protein [Chryseobacterium oryctis]|uniref:Uncharacterized protein n=1 Tax=Chryseobacterium oryctis TaxID=2952618 RepID=A0ABT3HJ49_9FLAO|nr:hypothetical protein [Chryseobacterium oryctis]MCW3159670.1 hypothetical protein [Chryseobacterium oryctis]
MNTKKQEPFIEHFDDLTKAMDFAVWKNFENRMKKEQFGVLDAPEENYAVVNQAMLMDLEMEFQYPLPEDYDWIDYNKIRTIRMDYDPLSHWEELTGAFSVMNGELLRFILKFDVPLKKFIRYELASRGYDENHQWVGFDKAEEIWFNSKR